MHIRNLTKTLPARAINLEEILFFGNGVIGLGQNVVNLIAGVLGILQTLTAKNAG